MSAILSTLESKRNFTAETFTLSAYQLHETRTAKIQIRIALMNRFSALGTAEIVCVA